MTDTVYVYTFLPVPCNSRFKYMKGLGLFIHFVALGLDMQPSVFTDCGTVFVFEEKKSKTGKTNRTSLRKEKQNQS